MKLYPVCLKVEQVPCLVAGGGNVALRKVKALLACGAAVTVASPKLCPGLEKLRQSGRFVYKRSVYRRQMLRGKFIVIAAAGDEKTNRRIARESRAAGKLINVVDNPRLGNFFVPAVLRKGNLLVSISTGGAFPGLAKKIRRELAPEIGKWDGCLRELAPRRAGLIKDIEDKRERRRKISGLLYDRQK